jgi:hypothetical protein
LAGGKVFAFIPGTSTPKDTYTNSGAGTPNAHPVILDSRGEAAIYWSGAYDIVLKDSADATIWGPERLETTDVTFLPLTGGTLTGALIGTAATFTGNTALGDATADTLSVSGSVIKNSTGNWTIPAPSSGAALTVNALTGTNSFVLTGSLSGSTVQGYYANTSNTATSAAGQVYSVGGSSAGDPFIIFDVLSVVDWTIGIDNSDSDKFKFSVGAALGTGDMLTLTTAGVVDLVAGSGSLRTNGHISRFESGEIATPIASGTVTQAHGGTREPDVVYAVLRCKTAELNWSIGDEIALNTVSGQDITVGGNATNCFLTQLRPNPSVLLDKTSAAATQVTAANWRLVFYALWL